MQLFETEEQREMDLVGDARLLCTVVRNVIVYYSDDPWAAICRELEVD
jgi:hypothetical protein